VLELAYRTRAKYQNCLVLWIPATDIESLHQAYLDVAQQLNITGWDNEKANVKKLVQLYLSKESTGRWLLVFDNADDINMWITKLGSEPGSGRLIEYLPQRKQGSIVFTTRDRKTAVKLAHQNIVEAPEMNEDVAIQLLQKRLLNPDLVNNRANTKALLKELTYLPLAIVQAVAYINENGIVFADYLSLLSEQEEDIIELLSEEFEDNGRYHNVIVKNPVATTWLISFEHIRHRDPLAADYLSFMACIHPKDIPQSLLPAGASQKKEIDAIGTLNAYSFIIKRSADLALDLHRLVYLATRNWLRKQELITLWTNRAIVRLEGVFPHYNHKNRSVWRTYLPHVRYVLISDIVEKDSKSRIDLAWRFGKCLYSDGQFKEAEAQFIDAMDRRKRVLGAEHPDMLTSMANIASTFWNQGRWKEAEELEVQVIETRKRVLGAEHPDTLTSMANLASTYGNQGRWKEAEELEMQVIETRKRVLGAEHPSTLTSISNLASTYWDQGWWKEAIKLIEGCVAVQIRILGTNHPSTSSSYAALLRWQKEELEISASADKDLGV
jgi:tetratricopeptide (TPR) repeat protein